MGYAETVKFVVAMIIMMNPLSSLSIFLQLTNKFSPANQQKTAFKCGVTMVLIMIITIWLGGDLLDLLGITIDSFRVAGGIILFLTGLSMLQSKESPLSHTPEDDIAAEERSSIAIVPLALPIIMGPGSISTLVITSNDYPLFMQRAWLTVLGVILAMGVGYILYHGVSIAKLIGESVIKVITRIMGMLIMAIAAGMFTNGLQGLIPSLR